MHFKRFGNKVIVRIEKDEEIVETLKQICKNLDIKLGTIIGIGATDNVKIGLFDPNSKEYHSTELFGDHEIAPLYGNITSTKDKPYLHLHVNLCNKKHKSFGGHLESAVVSATFEGVIDIIDGKVNRIYDKKTGLNLMEI